MSTIRVKMYPSAFVLWQEEGGIRRVCEAYRRHVQPSVEYVDDGEYAVTASHAAACDDVPDKPFVLHLHGLYWSADYPATQGEKKTNAHLVGLLRRAHVVTVPSRFVARVLRRDMRLDPIVVPHGIEPDIWRHEGRDHGYILWNKNRISDVCSPEIVTRLAQALPTTPFVTTFADDRGRRLRNVNVLGRCSHAEMVEIVKDAHIYLATTQETFGIGTVEAMAAGKPVLGFAQGALPEIVTHGEQGWLARPGDIDDLLRGLEYIEANYATLSQAARQTAQQYTWPTATRRVAEAYREAVERHGRPHNVSVVVPLYNKQETVVETLESILAQSLKPDKVVVVNNNSTDASAERVSAYLLSRPHAPVVLVNEERQGVAHARNAGIALCDTRYVACIDADDVLEPEFLEACVAALRADPDAGCAYPRLYEYDGVSALPSAWPGAYDFSLFLRGRNCVPTCAVFRRDLWERLGGYRQRYAPQGAGAEDANFWMRMGAVGYKGVLVDRYLFRYRKGGATSSDSYREVLWADMPWVRDGLHPFASVATPSDRLAHPVKSYDNPTVSVVIPVGEYHRDLVVDALDSVDNQTFRDWEVIVVWDGDDSPSKQAEADAFHRRFPYVTLVRTERRLGAGGARNLGASRARGFFLLFLDADDALHPDALRKMTAFAQRHPGHIVYTDYVIPERLTESEAREYGRRGRVLGINGKGEHLIRYNTFDYDCESAQRQPFMRDGRYYLWCNVTSLVPRAWHEEVGGFDEQMESWEDWDYWIRLARRGRCFARLAEPLLAYRFGTGNRRRAANPNESGEDGRRRQEFLLSYMKAKQGDEPMGCRGCGGKKAVPTYAPPRTVQAHTLNQGALPDVSADDLVTVELIDGNTAKHPIAVRGTSYGYRRTGDTFKMLRAHAALDGRVRIVSAPSREASSPSSPFPSTPPGRDVPTSAPPEPTAFVAAEVVDSPLLKIWGIGQGRVVILNGMGIRTVEDFLAADLDALQEKLGLTRLTLHRMLDSARKA